MARPSYNIIDLPLSFPHNFRHYNYFCKKALFPSIYTVSALLCTSFPARILRRYLIIQNWSVSKSTWFNIDLDEVLMNLTRPKVHPRMSHPTNSSPIPPFAHRSTDYYWLLSPPFGAGPKRFRCSSVPFPAAPIPMIWFVKTSAIYSTKLSHPLFSKSSCIRSNIPWSFSTRKCLSFPAQSRNYEQNVHMSVPISSLHSCLLFIQRFSFFCFPFVNHNKHSFTTTTTQQPSDHWKY